MCAWGLAPGSMLALVDSGLCSSTLRVLEQDLEKHKKSLHEEIIKLKNCLFTKYSKLFKCNACICR